MPLWNAIRAGIEDATGNPCRLREQTPVVGGCINSAWRLETSHGRYFVKLNDAERHTMFAAEAAGLEALAAAHAVRVPRPLCHGVAGDQAYLVLEYLELGRADRAAERRLGEELAVLHAVTADRFGWTRDNTIGSTPQPNGWRDGWGEFWCTRRLGHQLRLVADAGYPLRDGDRLLARVAVLLADHRPRPSLLHGDLWGGNWAALSGGVPVLFDPAVYHGDRETDLAMSELFGGFGADFYAAYRAVAPLDDGYPRRRDIYNLYHVLNHVALFGGGYAEQAQRLAERVLASG